MQIMPKRCRSKALMKKLDSVWRSKCPLPGLTAITVATSLTDCFL